MVSHNSEFTRKLRAAVRAKIEEYGIDVDDELPDYVMIMVGNKKDKTRMKTDLKLFLGDNTTSFVEWLFGFFQKVKQQQSASNSSLPAILSESSEKIVQPKEQPKKLTLHSGNDLFFGKAEKINTFSKTKPIESPKRKDKRDSSKTSKREKHSKSSKRVHSPKPKKEIKRVEKKQHVQTKHHSSKKHYSSDEEDEEVEKPSSPPSSLRKQTKIEPTKTEPVANAPPPSTTFAIPRAVLRSVVVHPQLEYFKPSNAPRILPPPRSPSPLVSADSPRFDIEYSDEDKTGENDKINADIESTIVTERPHNREVVVPKSKRKVSDYPSSRLFQRALFGAQGLNIEANTSRVNENKESEIINKQQNEETEAKIAKETTVDHHPIVRPPSPTGEKTVKKCEGVAKVFAKAIQETKKQSETLTNVQNRSVERRAVKRTVCVDELPNSEKNNTDFLENKRIRIEMEQPSITIKEEDDEDVDDLVLLVNLKATKRSICKERKKYKKPKFGLEMLKEHIKSSVVKTPKTTTTQVVEEDKIEEIKEKEVIIEKEEEVKEDETIDQNIQKEEVTVDDVTVEEKEAEEVETKEEENKLEIAVDAEQNDIRKIREFVVNLPISAPKSPSVLPLWDGCISIDDISSTDDEAEIDAVLEEQHNLKRMALEREKELKGRELPPTSALSRPLVHKRDVVVSLQEALMSPTGCSTSGGVSDLLQQSIQQQFLVASSSQQQQQQINNNNTTRPYATVAPCQITTPTFTSTASTGTNILQQQQVQQNDLLSLVSQIAASVNTQNQRMAIQPLRTKPKNAPSFAYRTFSKTYSPAINSYPFHNKAISQNQPVLTQLRDRHRQTSKLYSDMLEEQLLLLAQIQKMSPNPNNSEKVKTLMFRSKNIEKKTQQLKKQLEVLSASLENIKKSLN
uniref:Zinc finger CCCH domain-containing protein 14 n=2 Tax=Meloidogyne TaxID=189290 RepID=A0A915NU29_9BILA